MTPPPMMHELGWVAYANEMILRDLRSLAEILEAAAAWESKHLRLEPSRLTRTLAKAAYHWLAPVPLRLEGP